MRQTSSFFKTSSFFIALVCALAGHSLLLVFKPSMFDQHTQPATISRFINVELMPVVATASVKEPTPALASESSNAPVDDIDPPKPAPEQNDISLTEEPKPILRADIRAIHNFASRQIEDEIKHSEKLSDFNQTFVDQAPIAVQELISEVPNGMVNVQTSSFGKAVCYEFAADGDPPVALFKQCPNQDIKLEIE